MHNFQPLYDWGVSAHFPLLIKILAKSSIVWFPFTMPNPSDRLGVTGKPPCSRAGCATVYGARDQGLVTFGDSNQLFWETQREVNFAIFEVWELSELTWSCLWIQVAELWAVWKL